MGLTGRPAHAAHAALFVVVLCSVGAVTSAVKIVEGDSIHELVAHGEVKRVLRALEADPSQLNKRGLQQRTPLMHSVLSGQTAVVKALLKAGADASIPEKVRPCRCQHCALLSDRGMTWFCRRGRACACTGTHVSSPGGETQPLAGGARTRRG